MPLYEIQKLPTTSQEAIREFNDRYIASLGVFEPTGWADTLGALETTAAPMVTFPVSQLATKYQLTKGESKFKTLGEESFDIKTAEYDDGYEAKLIDIFQQSFAVRRWNEAAARFPTAEAAHRHHAIATLLHAGATTLLYNGGVEGGITENFFDTALPANLFDPDKGTFSNYNASGSAPLTVAIIEAEVKAMQEEVKDENGDLVMPIPDTLIVPAAYFEPVKNMLKKDMIANTAGTAGESNPYMNGFTVVPMREDKSGGADWYLVDSKLAAVLPPWMSLRQDVPPALALRWFDEASDYFKSTGKLRVTSHIWYGFGLGFPHAIRKIKV